MLKLILSFAPALALIISVNAHKSSLFGTAKYQLVAGQLLAGREYYGDIDFDERAFQKLMAERLPRNTTTLVVGSSRTMQLPHTCLEGTPYNASVSGAMLSDVAAILEQFRRGRDIRHVILSAEPWMLSAHEQSAAWNAAPLVPNLIRIQAAPDWIRAQLRLGLVPHTEDLVAAARATLEPLRALIDPSAFQTMLHSASAKPLAYFSPDTFRKLPEGDLSYPRTFHIATESAVRAIADEHLAKTYAGFDKIDPFLANAFEALTKDLTAHGTKVTLVLAPFHPVYYERVGAILPMAEAYYRSLRLETIGTYNPAGLPSASDAFLDAVHLRKESMIGVFGCPPEPYMLE